MCVCVCPSSLIISTSDIARQRSFWKILHQTESHPASCVLNPAFAPIEAGVCACVRMCVCSSFSASFTFIFFLPLFPLSLLPSNCSVCMQNGFWTHIAKFEKISQDLNVTLNAGEERRAPAPTYSYRVDWWMGREWGMGIRFLQSQHIFPLIR